MTVRELKEQLTEIIDKLDEKYGTGTADINVTILHQGILYNNVEAFENDCDIIAEDKIRTFPHIISSKGYMPTGNSHTCYKLIIRSNDCQ